jgi:hypothetical protein
MLAGIRQFRAWRLAAGATLGLACIGTVDAADMREFIHETQQSVTVGQQFTMAWWIPPEFWQVSLAANPNVPAQTATEILNVFHDYQVFALVRANAGLQGLTNVSPRADLLANSRFEVDTKAIQPLAPEDVPAGVQTMLGAMRPMLANMLGQLGQSMELVVYPGVADQHRLIDALQPGSFQFTLYDQTFHWRTPVASLLPPKVDPKTKEQFPGNYLYNPYTGGKLSQK